MNYRKIIFVFTIASILSGMAHANDGALSSLRVSRLARGGMQVVCCLPPAKSPSAVSWSLYIDDHTVPFETGRLSVEALFKVFSLPKSVYPGALVTLIIFDETGSTPVSQNSSTVASDIQSPLIPFAGAALASIIGFIGAVLTQLVARRISRKAARDDLKGAILIWLEGWKHKLTASPIASDDKKSLELGFPSWMTDGALSFHQAQGERLGIARIFARSQLIINCLHDGQSASSLRELLDKLISEVRSENIQ